MTYYLKYRPQKIEELDLEDVRNSLIGIIRSKNIPHAFLFSGPKGTGKTSAARILAKVVNCESASVSLRGKGLIEPCNKCRQCLSITKGDNIDVIEIDAASHRGIDDIRNLREAVKLVSVASNKKVYIIDEAHMLTLEASNALLKTLEEPPSHVIFVLATTNPEKLIETIRSRAVNILFKKATDEEIVRSLEKVAKGEKLKIPQSSLSIIAKASGGSFRDATKILEQMVAEKVKLNEDSVSGFVLGKGQDTVDRLVICLIDRDIKKSLELFDNSYKNGVSVNNLIGSLVEIYRNELLDKVLGKDSENIWRDKVTKEELVELIELLTDASGKLSTTVFEQIPMELAIIKWCDRENPGDLPDGNIGKKSEAVMRGGRQKRNLSEAESDSAKGDKKKAFNSEFLNSEVTAKLWGNVLEMVKPRNTSTEALLKAAKPVSFDGKVLTLGVFYSFHKERLESQLHRRIVENICGDVFGSVVKIECILTEPEVSVRKDTQKDVLLEEDKSEDIVKIAEEMFG